MSEVDMSTDSLEDCGTDLRFRDQMLGSLAGPSITFSEVFERKSGDNYENPLVVEEETKTQDCDEDEYEEDDDGDGDSSENESDDDDSNDDDGEDNHDERINPITGDDNEDANEHTEGSGEGSDQEEEEGNEEELEEEEEEDDRMEQNPVIEKETMEQEAMIKSDHEFTKPLDLSKCQASTACPGSTDTKAGSDENKKRCSGRRPNRSFHDAETILVNDADAKETGMRTSDEGVPGQQPRQGKVGEMFPPLGFSASLDEMLLQHGEFPCAPLITPSHRYYYKRTHRDPPLSSKPAHPCPATADAPDCYNHSCQLSPSSLPPVVSWRTCGGGESLCSFTDGDSSVSLAENNTMENIKCNPCPRYLPDGCLLPDGRPPPRPAHEPLKTLPPCKYPLHPPSAHWQPPPVHRKVSTTHYGHSQLHMIDGRSTKSSSGVEGEDWSPRRTVVNNVLKNARAFRSHPLFPLLRDLTVVDHYFDKATFNMEPLLSFLPSTTENMVTLYLRKNPQAITGARGDTQSSEVDAVVLDAMAYTHRSLLEKVTSKLAQGATRMRGQAEEDAGEGPGVQEMCDHYVDLLRSSSPLPPTLLDDHTVVGNDLQTSLNSLSHLDTLLAPLSPFPDTTLVPTLHSVSTTSSSNPSLKSATLQNVTLASTISSSTPNGQCHADSRRRTPNTHHSREAREVLRAWLKKHQHYPYPDDDQKAALVQRTGLTSQQVTQWLSNARRRHLPRLRADRDKE